MRSECKWDKSEKSFYSSLSAGKDISLCVSDHIFCVYAKFMEQSSLCDGISSSLSLEMNDGKRVVWCIARPATDLYRLM